MKKILLYTIAITILLFAFSPSLLSQQLLGFVRSGPEGKGVNGVTVYVKEYPSLSTVTYGGSYTLNFAVDSIWTTVTLVADTLERVWTISPGIRHLDFLFDAVTDYDGNSYNATEIYSNDGKTSQTWLDKNLEVTHYSNGEPVPNITSYSEWAGQSQGAYCDYNNLPGYSRLYNWYAVTDSLKLCPTGWHAPSNAEWTTLTDLLGGISVAGGKLKEVGTTHWNSPNTGATNISNFTALPGGYRDVNGSFGSIGDSSLFWSSTESNGGFVWNRLLFSNNGSVVANDINYKVYGFSMRCIKDTITTKTVKNITFNSAQSGGFIAENQADVAVQGVCWSTLQNPKVSDYHTATTLMFPGELANLGEFNATLTALSPKTTYYVRAYYTNSSGTITKYGSNVSFTTLSTLPTVLTDTITSIIKQVSALSGGNVTSDGGDTVTNRGICWSTNHNPTIGLATKTSNGSGTGVFTSSITGLTPGTTYYVRAYATNIVGTAYGNEISITTYNSDAITDIEGNYYNIVTIGSQIWMAENLKTTTLNTGTIIPLVTVGLSWKILVTPGYCWYNNEEVPNKDTYGALYNWYAVNTGILCPSGWHVPSDVEWTIMTNSLGGLGEAGGHLKEKGTTHWDDPNLSDNMSGFTARPGGERNADGPFININGGGYWWSTTESSGPEPYNRYIANNLTDIFIGTNGKAVGESVRCLKDYPKLTIVTNINDDGVGSLRYALDYANSTIGLKDTISFNIPGSGPFTIQPLSPLPAITDPVVINGFTQPGASNNGSVLQIGIDGSKAGTGSNGFTVNASNCSIKGLMIYQFTGNGIQILSGSGNLISSNSIYSNGAIGINLGSDVVTLNDANDADSGPNNLQNFPVLDSVKFDLGAKKVFVHGYLQSFPNSIFTLEFFTNKIGDNTGYGEGQTYLGSAQVTTAGNGQGVFGQSFAISSSWGDVISATATDSQGNTSEFAENVGGLQNQIIASDKWPFYFRTNVDGVLRITDGSDTTAVASSFESWGNISTANIDFRNGGPTTSKYASASDGMNLITFTDDQFPFSPGVLAIAAKTLKIIPGAADAQIIDADIVINPVFSRNDVGVGYNNPNAGTYDIQSIVTHEIGHVLGLLHSGIYNSTMFYMLGQGTKVRSLEQDDKSWASYRYPKAGYSSTYGSISGNIIYGYDNQPVAGALIMAINTSTKDTVHAYSDAYGNYLVPGLSAAQYNIYIEPLDGSSKVYKLKPGNISSYMYCNTIYTDYPGEFYSNNEGAVETSDNPVNITVSAGHETTGINLITNKDVTKPKILSVYPPKDSTNIDVTSDIIITFSEPVDKSTLTDKTCYLESGGKAHGVNYTTIGNSSSIILVALDSALKYSTSYNIYITTGVTDLRGNNLETAYQSSFTTGSADLTPPEITGTYPVDKADTVFVMDKVTVFFSEPMNKTSVENNFTLTWADGTPSVIKKVDGSFTWDKDNKSLTFTPLISLKEGTEYTITVSAVATDQSGNHLTAVNLFKFTTVPTAAPVVVYLGPVNQEDSVSVTTPVVADFSEPVDPASVTSSTFNLKLNGVIVPGSFEFLNENSRVILRPDANLGFGKTYLVTLTTGIKDVSNPSLNMKADKTGTFVTASQLTVPHISYLEPPAGTIGSDVIIAGTGFDPNPLNNAVKFNTTSAVVTSATLTSLTTKVPLGASSGAVTVAGKNAVQADNSMYFYVIPQSDNPCDVVVANSSVGTKSTKDVAVDPNAAFAYVTNPLSDQVTVLDLVRSTVVKSISVGKTPMKIDINPSGSLAYVTNFNSNDVSVISLATNTVIRTIKVGIQPYGIAVTPNGKGVYVANYFSENVSLIDVDPYSGGFDHVVANVPTGTKTSNVAVSPDAGMVLVTGDFGLRIIDANPKDANYNCVVATASSGTKTKDVAVSPDAGLAIVSTEEGNLLVINLHPENGNYSDAVVANVPSGTNISNVKVSGDNMFVYASATDKNELLVYKITQGSTGATNGSSVSGITLVPHNTISVGDAPEGLVIDAKAENIYVIDGATASRQVTTIRLCCGPVDPAKAIGDLIMSIQNMINAGNISQANGKEIIDKLNLALSDLLKGKTKNAINDLNAFSNKVKAQINGHKISAAQGQPLINSVNIIITQLNGTKSALGEPYTTDETEQAKQDLITESRLGVIYPNPFGESITINYEIAGNNEVPAEVHITIYDINGILAGTLVDEKMQTGRYSVSWNGRLENGNPAPFGTYFVLLRTGKVSEIRKVMFIK
jgi:uncharacterized protein (TIGR02145 family)